SDHNFYVLRSEHNAGNTDGQLLLDKFAFDSTTPVQVVFNPLTGGPNVIYSWVNSDAANNAMLVADNNIPSFTDPVTGKVQTDHMGGKALYVAFNTNSVAPAVDTRFANNNNQIDFNGFPTAGGGRVQFNPNAIQLMASVDGGRTFTPPLYVNGGFGVP